MLSDSGPTYDWQKVQARKSVHKPSPVPVQKVFNWIFTDLRSSDAGNKNSVSSRLDFSYVHDRNLVQPLCSCDANHQPIQKVWVPRTQTSLPVHGARDEQGANPGPSVSNFQNDKRSFLQAVFEGESNGPSSSNVNVLTGANTVTLGPHVPSVFHRLVGPCSCCFSHLHGRASCFVPIRCAKCFRLGHVASRCRFPPRFPGLSKNPSFYNQINLNCWDSAEVAQWFKKSLPLPGGTTRPGLGVSVPDLSRPSPFPLHAEASTPSSTFHRQENPLSLFPELALHNTITSSLESAPFPSFAPNQGFHPLADPASGLPAPSFGCFPQLGKSSATIPRAPEQSLPSLP